MKNGGVLMLAENPIPAHKRVSRPHYLATGLAKQGIKVRTITYRSQAPSGIPGCDHFYIPTDFEQFDPIRRMMLFTGAYPLIREIIRKRPALLHGQGFLPGIIVVCCSRLFNIPCIVGMPDFVEVLYQSFQFPMQKAGVRVLSRLNDFIVRNADALVVESELAKEEWLRRGHFAERIHPIHHAADVQRFDPAISGREAQRRLGLEGRTIVSYHGDIGEDDGVDLLINAFKSLAGRFPEAHLLIIGSGAPSYISELKSMARPVEGRVTFTGWVPYHQMPVHLAAADIGVAPFRSTLYTNTVVPTKAIEVMAMAKPLVVTDLATFSERLHPGRDCLVAAPDSESSLAQALAMLLEDPGLRAELGRRGCELVQKEFSWDIQIGKEAALIKKMMSQNGKKSS